MAKQEPASIRYNNPGAMWGGNAISRKWGELSNVELHDGKNQNNHIAGFPSKIHGAAAQFDLWMSPRYKDKPFKEGIAMWAGGNSVPQYIKLVTERVPGMTGDTIMSREFLSSERGLMFVKAQAFQEAGKEYPMSDVQWREAQSRVFTKVLPQKPVKVLTTRTGQLATVTGVATSVATGAQVINSINTTTDTIQTVSENVSTAKDAVDKVVVVYQSAKPFLGILPETWRIIAVCAGVIAILGVAGVLWYRHVKIRDTGE